MLYDSQINVPVKNLVSWNLITQNRPKTESGKSSGDEYPLSATSKTGGEKQPPIIIAHSCYTILFVVNGVDSFVFICRLLFLFVSFNQP